MVFTASKGQLKPLSGQGSMKERCPDVPFPQENLALFSELPSKPLYFR